MSDKMQGQQGHVQYVDEAAYVEAQAGQRITTCEKPHHPDTPHYCGLHSWAQVTEPVYVPAGVTPAPGLPLCERTLPAKGTE